MKANALRSSHGFYGDYEEKYMTKKRNTFKGSVGFVLAAAGSAVGLGNIWRFPYLAAKNGGGIFLVVYIVLALTFGFALLTTEIAVGRHTKQSPLTAYSVVRKGWGPLGLMSCIVPMIILPYYVAIGGWVLHYFLLFATGRGVQAADSGYFEAFTGNIYEPVIAMAIFFILAAFVILKGVNKGIEASSKILMPLLLLLIIGISIYSLTIEHVAEDGTVRTGLQGLKIYLIPDFEGMTVSRFFGVVMDAMGQLFFSLSVAMGILIAYGSYVSDEANLPKSINQIEFFDTLVAFLAGVTIIPAVFVFMGADELSKSGPSLMFISIPKVFASMGSIGNIIGAVFFAMVLFAALTSAISIYEAITSSFMDKFHISRTKATIAEGIIALSLGVLVCLGFNILSFSIPLPNGSSENLLGVMDYVSNNLLMPVVAILTCILFGWVIKPQFIIDEVEKSGHKMGRRRLYSVMIRYIAPIMLSLLLMKSLGILGDEHMDVVFKLILLAVGFVMLMKGADWFVDGAAKLAGRFGIPQIIIGLTVVAVGTSLPEAAVSITSAIKGASDLSIGNILGSNIMNVLVILGVTSLICIIPVARKTLRFDIPFVLLVTVLLAFMCYTDSSISRIEGAILIAIMVFYMIYLTYRVRKGDELDEVPECDSNMKLPILLLLIVVGGISITLGSQLTVKAATGVATLLGVEERIIGLTVVAFGTSLPELVTSITAARKKETDIAIGNIVGSNLFNIVFVLGITAVIRKIPCEGEFLFDCAAAILTMAVLFVLAAPRKRLGKLSGLLMLSLFAAYFAYTVI